MSSRSVAGTALVPDPSEASNEFTTAVADLARRWDAVAVMPGGETTLLALADAGDAWPQSIATLAVCDRERVYRVTDKTLLPEVASEAGLRMPETRVVSAEEVADGRLPLRPPAVVKPLRSQMPTPDGFRHFSVRIAISRDDVVAALRALPGGRGLLQSYHHGDLSAVGGVFWDGKVVAAVHQRAIRLWPNPTGQMSFAIAIPRDTELEMGIARLLSGFGWQGMFQLQFVETENGRLLIDLNPRPYGSLALALAAGQNLPGIWANLLQGRELPPTPYRHGVSFRNEQLDAHALLASARTVHLTSAGELARGVSRRATVHAYYETGDSMPLLALGSRKVRKFRGRASSRLSNRSRISRALR
jgi:predicted ATP-grasp superfamily ATP-dependent carboligase